MRRESAKRMEDERRLVGQICLLCESQNPQQNQKGEKITFAPTKFLHTLAGRSIKA